MKKLAALLLLATVAITGCSTRTATEPVTAAEQNILPAVERKTAASEAIASLRSAEDCDMVAMYLIAIVEMGEKADLNDPIAADTFNRSIDALIARDRELGCGHITD
jgi:hypothetical protein